MNSGNKNVRRARALLALYAAHKIANGANPAKTMIRTGIMDVESSRRVAGKAALKKKTDSAGRSSARASGLAKGAGKVAKLALRALKVI